MIKPTESKRDTLHFLVNGAYHYVVQWELIEVKHIKPEYECCSEASDKLLHMFESEEEAKLWIAVSGLDDVKLVHDFWWPTVGVQNHEWGQAGRRVGSWRSAYVKKRRVTVEDLIAIGAVIVIHKSSDFKYYANVAKLSKHFSYKRNEYAAYFGFYQDEPHFSADSVEEVVLKARVSCPELRIVEVMKQNEMPDGQMIEWHFYTCGATDIMDNSVQVYEVMA